MKTMILHKLVFAFDRERNGLVFQGLLEDGYQFEVLFPIGHVSLQFEKEAAALGFCGQPLLGDIETVDGFLGAIETLQGVDASQGVEMGWFGSKLVKSVSHAVNKAVGSTVGKVAKQAVAAARQAVNLTPVGQAYNLASAAVSGKNLLSAVPGASGINAIRSVATGGNVLKVGASMVPVNRQNLKLVAQYGANVPGLGTAAGALASGANAALSGQSLTDIAKATAVGAMPGGPLAQAAASAALNMVQAGVEGQNLVRAAAGELVNVAVSMAPPATQAMIRSAAMAAISGRNVISAVQRSAIQMAISQVPDASVRAVLTDVATGRATAQSLITAAGGQLVGKAVTGAPSGAVSRMLNSAASVAPSTPHFPAISAAGLAATHVANAYGNMVHATPTRANVSTLAKATAGLKAVTHPSNPHAGLMVAALQSVPVRAA
jgi:hypothetical protein